jgi:hypothetical protein
MDGVAVAAYGAAAEDSAGAAAVLPILAADGAAYAAPRDPLNALPVAADPLAIVGARLAAADGAALAADDENILAKADIAYS